MGVSVPTVELGQRRRIRWLRFLCSESRTITYIRIHLQIGCAVDFVALWLYNCEFSVRLESRDVEMVASRHQI